MFFFFNDTATTEIYTLSLHDALPICGGTALRMSAARFRRELRRSAPLQRELYRYTHSLMAQITQTAACNRFHRVPRSEEHTSELQPPCNFVCRLLLEKKRISDEAQRL